MNFLANNLDILNEQMSIGDVKIITNGDKNVKYVELLFSPTTKVQFAPTSDMKSIMLTVSDNNLESIDLECVIEKQTMRNFLVALKNVYRELIDSEVE